MPSILTFSEQHELSLELLTPAKELSKQLGAEVHSLTLESKPEELTTRGASTVYRAKNLTEYIELDQLQGVLLTCISMAEPVSILLSATRNGKDLAGRLAARLHIPCISEAVNIKASADSEPILERIVWGGKGIAKTIPKTNPFIATIPPKRFSKPERYETSKGKVVEIDLPPTSGRLKTISVNKKTGNLTDLHSAKVIVGAGRGFRLQEDLKLGESLATALGGILCGSRPLTADLKWLPEDRQIGLSGVTVSPNLYVAVGISGQIQHLVGIRDSKIIVAINNDKTAPIFEECDYAIVGDLYTVIPAIIEELEKRRR